MAIIFILALVVFIFAAMWKIFEKAGQPGWAAIVPIYNIYIMTKIAEKPEWWTFLALIPFVNYVVIIWMWNRIVLRFGKTEAFTVGVVLLGIVFIPILGFGDAQYKGTNQSSNMDSDIIDDILIEG